KLNTGTPDSKKSGMEGGEGRPPRPPGGGDEPRPYVLKEATPLAKSFDLLHVDRVAFEAAGHAHLLAGVRRRLLLIVELIEAPLSIDEPVRRSFRDAGAGSALR